EEIAFTDRTRIAALTRAEWDEVVAAAAAALDPTLQEQILEEDLATIRDEVRDLITADLPDEQRTVAGNLAAALVEPTHVIDDELTDAERAEARAAVPPVEVTIAQGETIVSEGQVITEQQIE